MVVKNIYLHSSSNSATAREIRTEDNDIYLNNTAHKTENVNCVQISRFFTFTLTSKEQDPLRLYLQSGELCRARLTSPPDLFTGYSHLPHQARQAHHGA